MSFNLRDLKWPTYTRLYIYMFAASAPRFSRRPPKMEMMCRQFVTGIRTRANGALYSSAMRSWGAAAYSGTRAHIRLKYDARVCSHFYTHAHTLPTHNVVIHFGTSVCASLCSFLFCGMGIVSDDMGEYIVIQYICICKTCDALVWFIEWHEKVCQVMVMVTPRLSAFINPMTHNNLCTDANYVDANDLSGQSRIAKTLIRFLLCCCRSHFVMLICY